MWRDFRYAIRSLHRDSRLSTIIILVIGLGVGANTAIFSLINGVLLRPLPFERPDRLVFLWETAPYLGLAQSEASLPNFLDWQRDARFFEDMAAARAWSYNLTGAGEPQKLDGAAVTGNLFSILGVAPAHGRLFQASEQQPGSERVVVLSYDLWQTTFGGDVGAIGRDITLNDMQYTVVGVMPRGFQFPRQRTDLWAPAVFPDFLKRARGPKFLVPVGRLRDGVTVQAAQSELTAIAQRLAKAYPRSNADTSVRLEPIAEEYVGDVRKPYGVLLAAAGLVLLIVCANVANLFLVRAANHRKETPVRVALGAGRAHLIRQRLAESLLLSSAGSALGLLFAVWTSGFLVRLVPVELSRWAGVGIDWRVLGFALALTLLTSITFSVGLAMDGVRLNLYDALKATARTSTSDSGSGATRRVLVAAQFAIAVVLVAGAGLLIQTLANLQSVDLGFQTRNVLALRAELPQPRYSEPQTRETFYREALARVRALPGVAAAGFSSYLPLAGPGALLSFTPEGASPSFTEQPHAECRFVTEGYLEALAAGRHSTRFLRRHPGVSHRPQASLLHVPGREQHRLGSGHCSRRRGLGLCGGCSARHSADRGALLRGDGRKRYAAGCRH